jgi:outer membrane protein assembly factor BamB
MQANWGTAASPVLHGDRIYVVNDNQEKSFMAALDKLTGKDVWRVDRDEKSNWSTPFIWEHAGRTEIVTNGTRKVRSYGLDGKLLWELGGMSSITIPTPCAGKDLLYVSSGFVMDLKKPVVAIRPGASGDISLKSDETANRHVAWCQKMAAAYNPSPLLYGDRVYVLYDLGQLACYDAQTGKELYGKTRIAPKTRAFTSSPWAYQGKVFCLSEDGDTFVIEAGPKFKLLRTNSLGELCLATPAIARQSLVLRTETQLFRIQQ